MSSNAQNTRTNIIEAFWQLYLQQPIHRITVKAVIERAGYNRSTFYEYFADVFDVLTAIENRLVNETDTFIDAAQRHEDDADILTAMTLFYEHRGIWLSRILAGSDGVALTRKLKKHFAPAFFKYWQLSPENPSDVLAYEFVMSAVIGTLTAWYDADMPISSAAMITMLRRMVIQGVYPQIGGPSND